MRLLFVADGRSVHTQRWLSWFATAGHDVHLITDSSWPGALGVSVHELAAVAAPTIGAATRFYKVRYLA